MASLPVASQSDMFDDPWADPWEEEYFRDPEVEEARVLEEMFERQARSPSMASTTDAGSPATPQRHMEVSTPSSVPECEVNRIIKVKSDCKIPSYRLKVKSAVSCQVTRYNQLFKLMGESRQWKTFNRRNHNTRAKIKRYVSVLKTRFVKQVEHGGTVLTCNNRAVERNLDGIWEHQKDEVGFKWLEDAAHNHEDPKIREGSTALLMVFLCRNVAAEVKSSKSSHLVLNHAQLLTWNGQWGLFESVDDNGRRVDNIKTMSNIMSRNKEVQSEFHRVRHVLEELVDTNVVKAFAVCAEISPETFAKGQTRMHLHAWLCPVIDSRANVVTKTYGVHIPLDHLKIGGVHPVVSDWQQGHSGRQDHSGCFYCEVDKKGHIMGYSTKRMFHDYVVKTTWITRMLTKKLTYTSAMRLYAHSSFQAKALMENVMFLQKYQAKQDMIDEQIAIDKRWRETACGFRHIAKVESWLEAFTVFRDRYDFLVMDGPSKMGKTRFVASMCFPEQFLLLDCSRAETPDLKDFERDLHEIICFDEASANMVIQSKKVFQSGLDICKLATSATNVNAYSVLMHRKKLVVCSNKWMKQVNAMTSVEDKEWLFDNSVYVYIDSKLYV